MSNEYELVVPVLPVEQPIGTFFIASMDARHLVEISYADVRRLASEERDVERYLGIQRPLSSRRVNNIKRYIASKDATFPTAIILAIDERCAEYDESKGVLTLRAYAGDGTPDEEIPYQRIAKVLDGQHRIAAFLDGDVWDSRLNDVTFDLNVALFIGADISEQANIFATVNLTQTKVTKSLAYDLTELARTRSPYRTCHNVAVALDGEDSSPLFRRIKRLGTATPGRSKEPLTQAGFVEALVPFISTDPIQDRNDLLDGKKPHRPTQEELKKTPFRGLFVSDKDLDIAEILYNYFNAIKKRWPASWDNLDKSGNLLPKSNAFKAFMKFLREDVYPAVTNGEFGRIPSEREFAPFFRDLKLDDADFTTRNFSPGSGGQAMFLKLLRKQIALDDLTVN